jgi:hypothetical protein
MFGLIKWALGIGGGIFMSHMTEAAGAKFTDGANRKWSDDVLNKILNVAEIDTDTQENTITSSFNSAKKFGPAALTAALTMLATGDKDEKGKFNWFNMKMWVATLVLAAGVYYAQHNLLKSDFGNAARDKEPDHPLLIDKPKHKVELPQGLEEPEIT